MPRTKRPVWKTILYSLLIISITLFAAGWVMMSYWEPILIETVKSRVKNGTEGLYNVSVGKVSVNLLRGRITLKNIELTYDSNKYKQLRSMDKEPVFLYTLSLSRLRITGLDIYELATTKNLILDKLELEQPLISVQEDLEKQRSEQDSSRFRNPYDLMKGALNRLQIDDIRIQKIQFIHKSKSSAGLRTKKYNINYFTAQGFFIDSAASKNKNKPFFTDDIRLSIKDFEFPLKDQVNKIRFEELVLSTRSKSVDVYNFKLIPLQPENKFTDTNGFRKLRVQLYCKEASFKGVDFKKVLVERRFFATQADVRNLDLKLFQDKRRDVDPEKIKLFPQELFKKINYPFFVSTVNIARSHLQYAEHLDKKDVRWVLNLNDLRAALYNVGNDPQELQKNSRLKIIVDGNAQNAAKMHAKLVFDYLHPRRSFYVKGSFSNSKLQSFNSIIQNFAPLEIANCNLRTLEFIMRGNDQKMKVGVTMLYNNLRVNVLQYDKKSDELKKSGLFSALANAMVLHNDNPSVNGKLEQPNFIFLRPDDAGFWSYIWKGLFRGIKESIGFTERLEAETKEYSSRYKEYMLEREKRKVARLLRQKAKAVADAEEKQEQ